jgi:phage gpG-like protein
VTTLDHLRNTARRLAQERAGLRAEQIRTEVVEQLSQPGRGKRYKKGSVVHLASAPGDPPAVDSGRLRQSITVLRLSDDHYRVGTNVVYAPLLEFGSRKVAPRPFMRPALEKVRRG